MIDCFCIDEREDFCSHMLVFLGGSATKICQSIEGVSEDCCCKVCVYIDRDDAAYFAGGTRSLRLDDACRTALIFASGERSPVHKCVKLDDIRPVLKAAGMSGKVSGKAWKR